MALLGKSDMTRTCGGRRCLEKHAGRSAAETLFLARNRMGGEAPVLRPAERRRIGVRLSEIKALLSRADPQPWYGQLMLPQAIAYFLQLDHWLRIYRVRLL